MQTSLKSGVELWKKGELSSARRFFADITVNLPENWEAWANLGNVYKDMGLLIDADSAYKQALKIAPNAHWIESNRLFCLNYREDVSVAALMHEHNAFGERFPNQQTHPTWKNMRDKDRRLSVGFVSGDLRSHSVAFFLTGLWCNLDRGAYEIIVFSENTQDDEMTEVLRSYSDAWVKTAGMPSETFTKMVRRSRIDVLIDLSGHTAYNRLPEFAQNLAPVQISWLGYPTSVGLGRGHYFMAPKGIGIDHAGDQLLTVEAGIHAYESPLQSITEKTGFSGESFRFGCFNNRSKVSPGVIRVWAEILSLMPQATLFLKSRAYQDGGVCEAIIAEFDKYSIQSTRIHFLPRTQSISEHLSLMQSMDVMLDTFPYNGTTTTFEALSVGVPVITMEQETPASRVGAAILRQLRKRDWIAHSGKDYVRKVVDLANDVKQRRAFAGNAGKQMFETGLTDSRLFAQRWTHAIRGAWHQFCEDN